MTTEQRADQRSGFRLPWGANRTPAMPELGDDDQARDAGHGDGLARIGQDGWDVGAQQGASNEDEPIGGWPGRHAGFDGDAGAPAPEDARFPGMTADGMTPDVAARAEADAGGPMHDVEWPAEDVARLRAIAAAAPLVDSGADEESAQDDPIPPVDLARIFNTRVARSAGDAEAEPALSQPASHPSPEDAPTAEAAGSAAPVPDADDPSATDARVAEAPAIAPAARPSGRSDREARRLSAPTASSVRQPTPAAAPPAPAPAVPAAGLASKFMADLSRAMQSAAQAARDEALARLSTEAGTRIETIGKEADSGRAELKRAAEDDIAATRDWSRAEMARIKEETDRRIADRKARLDGELADHAERIHRRTDGVREALAAYEAELGRFVEQVLAEEDPTRIATLAQRLPEPPALDVAEASSMAEAIRALPEPAAAARPVAGPQPATTLHTPDVMDDAAHAGDEDAVALAEAQALADAEAEAQAMAEAEAQRRMTAESAAAAEAEALAGLDGGSDAWFASQGADKGRKGSASIVRSELIVTGLASVAGIAGFKRELSAIDGVRHVGVSAGHAGEFVFAVGHAPTMDLAGVIPTLSAFAPQVTGRRDGALLVAATEPAAGE